MQAALVGSALLMGLAGGPHCAAMCGAACAGVIRIVRAPPVGGGAVLSTGSWHGSQGTLAFHAGRIGGYAVAGALAAVALQSIGLASERVGALRPLWALLHAAMLLWGLSLAVLGRQPPWAHRLGRALSARLRPLTGSMFGVLATGALWVFMPCGLLYSALMLAALANGALHGAAVMAAFAAGGSASLILGPWFWQKLRTGAVVPREWGTRLAGGLLAAMALHAMGADLARQIELWCR